MSDLRERQIGWAGSIVFHLFLLLLLFFLHVPELLQKQEFIEVSWGATASPSLSRAVSTVSDAARTPSVATKQPMKTTGAAQPVVLPERRSVDLSDEVIRVPKTEKMEVPEPGSKAQPGESAAVGDRENRREIGDRERLTPGSTTGGGSGGTSPLSSTGVGVATDRGVSYSVQWLDGGSRHKISGELPRYPEGVNVEAQIKILTVVLPDGTVKDVSPAQKANTKLEEAAMKEVRLWRFEPLRSNLPQLEQHAVITFLFTLK